LPTLIEERHTIGRNQDGCLTDPYPLGNPILSRAAVKSSKRNDEVHPSARFVRGRRPVNRHAIFHKRAVQQRIDRGPRPVDVDGNVTAFDRVVIAAGAWSRRLIRTLGIDLPLDTERGYHVMLRRYEPFSPQMLKAAAPSSASLRSEGIGATAREARSEQCSEH
jgi:glycine/D-amino acid oxidase-like deaminating enzyme